jgi:uncharacterized membrane protein YkvA (DUF1232 family)
MPVNLGRVRAVLFEVPRNAKLAYSLMRDDRVPLPPKVALGASLGLIVSPLDIPAWIPVIGDLDVLALGILAVKVFVDACPERVVEEHEAAMRHGESLFDQDLRAAIGLAREGAGRLSRRWLRGRRGITPPLEDEPA